MLQIIHCTLHSRLGSSVPTLHCVRHVLTTSRTMFPTRSSQKMIPLFLSSTKRSLKEPARFFRHCINTFLRYKSTAAQKPHKQSLLHAHKLNRQRLRSRNLRRPSLYKGLRPLCLAARLVDQPHEMETVLVRPPHAQAELQELGYLARQPRRRCRTCGQN